MLISQRVVSASTAVACTLLFTVATAPAASAQSEPVVIASGLNSPRHLSFSPDGELYVAEAGSGGPRPGGPGTPNCAEHPLGLFCLGATGSVTHVRVHGPDDRVLTGLPSISNGAEPVGPEALGPSDIAFTGNQKFVLSIGLGGSDTFRAKFGADGALLGTLVTGKLNKSGWSLFADVVANEAVANPDGTDIDSNPVGILRDGEGYVVADAGGNAIVRASHKGTFTTVGVVPPTAIGADAVPTSVVRGPDDAYLLQPAHRLPVPAGCRQHLASGAGPRSDGLRIGADEPHRSGVHQRRVAVRRRDRGQRSPQRTDRRAREDQPGQQPPRDDRGWPVCAVRRRPAG